MNSAAANGSGKAAQQAASSGETGRSIRAATRITAFWMPSRATSCISRWLRVAAKRMDSSRIASGNARPPCDWHRIASIAATMNPNLAPPIGSVRGSKRSVRVRISQIPPMMIAGGKASSGRCRPTAAIATTTDWTPSRMPAALIRRVPSKANAITNAMPPLPWTSAIMPSPNWPGP